MTKHALLRLFRLVRTRVSPAALTKCPWLTRVLNLSVPLSSRPYVHQYLGGVTALGKEPYSKCVVIPLVLGHSPFSLYAFWWDVNIRGQLEAEGVPLVLAPPLLGRSTPG